MSYIHTETFRIRTSEINHLKCLHPHTLIQLMQEASMQHTIGMKVSVWDMEAWQGSWVLLKMEVHFYRLPALNQVVTVSTYPSGLDGYFTYRDYFMYTEDNQLCATASTTWTMMNTSTRKMMKIPFEYHALVYNNPDCLPRPDFKLTSFEQVDDGTIVAINYFHLDWNGHVNNVTLIKMIMETLENIIHYEYELSGFFIQYKQEALPGQKVRISHLKTDEQQFRHMISDTETGKELVLAASYWRKKESR